MTTFPWFWMAVLGVAVGFFSGLLGIGGGIIMIPVLVLLMSMTQQAAQGISLAVMAPVALFGAWKYFQHPTLQAVDRRYWIVGILIVMAMVGTTLGTRLALHLPPGVLRRVFAVAMIAMGVRMWFK